MNKTYAIYSFGCKVNQEEGGALAALFDAALWQNEADAPGLIIINTCTVTAIADKKSRNLIRRLRKENPDAIMVVCGCYSQRAADEISAIGGVDIIVGVDDRRHLPRLVENYLRAIPKGEPLVAVSPIDQVKTFHRIAEKNIQKRTRAFLKIEDGCDQFCNYCIIPHVRGPVRSLPKAAAVEQAKQLVDAGHQEIVLSGIHIGAYGSDLPIGQDLPALIRALLDIDGLLRLRLGSIEPQQFNDELIDLFAAKPRICAHLHIPLQSGSDKILAVMGRRYDTLDYSALLNKIQNTRPDTAITTDIIVGYPGESKADFADGLTFVSKMAFAKIHIFPYSQRSGTPAAEHPGQLSRALKAERAAILNDIAAKKTVAYWQSFIDHELDLLAEEIIVIDGKTYLSGHSSNYLPLFLPWAGNDLPRGLITVQGIAVDQDGLIVASIPSRIND